MRGRRRRWRTCWGGDRCQNIQLPLWTLHKLLQGDCSSKSLFSRVTAAQAGYKSFSRAHQVTNFYENLTKSSKQRLRWCFLDKFLIVFSHQRRELQLCDCTYETLRLDLMYENEKMDIMTKGYSFVNNNSCLREVILCCSQKWSGCPNVLNSFHNLSQKPRRSSALWVHFFFRQWMTSFVQRSLKLGSFFGARNQHFWSTDPSNHVLIYDHLWTFSSKYFPWWDWRTLAAISQGLLHWSHNMETLLWDTAHSWPFVFGHMLHTEQYLFLL